MEIGTMCIIGGAAIAAGIIIYACSKKSNSSSSTLTEAVAGATDEQLVVDHLSGKDLTSWFREKNPTQNYMNVILYPNEKNIAQFHLPKNIINNAGNLIVQAVFNEKTNQIVICRSVLFESIDDKLSNTLAQHDGIVIVE